MAGRELNLSSVKEFNNAIADKIVDMKGNPDDWKIINRITGRKSWMYSTRALEIKNVGCLVQTKIIMVGKDLQYAPSISTTFVPGVCLHNNKNGSYTLVKLEPQAKSAK